MAIINIMNVYGSLSNKNFFDVHLNVGETAQVGNETLYGPCWAVITAYKKPVHDKTGNLIWKKGEVRISVQNPVRKIGQISVAWMRHFHPQRGFRKPGEWDTLYWSLPEYTGEQDEETLSQFKEWRVNCSGGYTPEAPNGWVVVSPTTMSNSSWLLMREGDARIEKVWEY